MSATITLASSNAQAAIDTYRGSHPAGDPAVTADLQANWQNYVQIAQTKLLPASRANASAARNRPTSRSATS